MDPSSSPCISGAKVQHWHEDPAKSHESHPCKSTQLRGECLSGGVDAWGDQESVPGIWMHELRSPVDHGIALAHPLEVVNQLVNAGVPDLHLVNIHRGKRESGTVKE